MTFTNYQTSNIIAYKYRRGCYTFPRDRDRINRIGGSWRSNELAWFVTSSSRNVTNWATAGSALEVRKTSIVLAGLRVNGAHPAAGLTIRVSFRLIRRSLVRVDRRQGMLTKSRTFSLIHPTSRFPRVSGRKRGSSKEAWLQGISDMAFFISFCLSRIFLLLEKKNSIL